MMKYTYTDSTIKHFIFKRQVVGVCRDKINVFVLAILLRSNLEQIHRIIKEDNFPSLFLVYKVHTSIASPDIDKPPKPFCQQSSDNPPLKSILKYCAGMLPNGTVVAFAIVMYHLRFLSISHIYIVCQYTN